MDNKKATCRGKNKKKNGGGFLEQEGSADVCGDEKREPAPTDLGVEKIGSLDRSTEKVWEGANSSLSRGGQVGRKGGGKKGGSYPSRKVGHVKKNKKNKPEGATMVLK